MISSFTSRTTLPYSTWSAPRATELSWERIMQSADERSVITHCALPPLKTATELSLFRKAEGDPEWLRHA